MRRQQLPRHAGNHKRPSVRLDIHGSVDIVRGGDLIGA